MADRAAGGGYGEVWEMGSRTRRPAGAGRPESLGQLLARLRVGRGLSQLRLAELLCAAASAPTVTRHEVSRWERDLRVPGRFWRTWLAVVLQAPLDQLEAAIAATGYPPAPHPARGDQHRLWRPPTAADLLAVLDHGAEPDLRELAHTWLAGPAGAADSAAPAGGIDPASAGWDAPDRLAARLRELRRQDDHVGGIDHAGLVQRELRAAVATLRTADTGARRRRLLPVVAGFAQLAGWAHADAGEPLAAQRAYRVALHAATAAGDRSLAAHVLGALSHHRLAAGDAAEALVLARTGYAGARSGGSPLTRALLLHRVALAAARAGERRAAELALADARRAVDRSEPGQEPDWLYWLDQAELEAMTGRCLAALGRPLRAARLLARRRRVAMPVRTAALYGTCLARCYLALGEVERACRHAEWALRDAVAGASQRAVDELRHLHPLLLRYRDLPAVRWYQRRFATGAGYLPDADLAEGRWPSPEQERGPWRQRRVPPR